jgi:hypothetical protein
MRLQGEFGGKERLSPCILLSPPHITNTLLNMEYSSNTADDKIDEWGKYIVKSEDVMRIGSEDSDDELDGEDSAGVLDCIKQNNPAITAVHVMWKTAWMIGLRLGKS